MRAPRVLGIVLAGGEGKRLSPLTADRAKPAVPFGGIYRLVDFVLSNLVNAGYLRIVVLTQYKSHSLDRHITTTWRMSTLLGNYITPVPAQQRLGPQWYRGSADAIHQSLNLVYDERPEHVVVFGADHVYRMDPRQMVEQHIASGAGVTVAGHPRPALGGARLRRHPDRRRRAHGSRRSSRSRPTRRGCPTTPTPSTPRWATTSSRPRRCSRRCKLDAGDEGSVHDMGGNIIPMMVERGAAQVYDFSDNDVPGATDRDRGYWRDVGTLDSYYDAHMDLVSIHPIFNLYNRQWPILTHAPALPPAKFVFEEAGRIGQAVDSLVSQGVIVSGGRVRRSVVSPGRARQLRLGGAGQRAHGQRRHRPRRRRAQRHPRQERRRRRPGRTLGVDPEHDRARGWTVTDNGIVVVGKGEIVKA